MSEATSDQGDSTRSRAWLPWLYVAAGVLALALSLAAGRWGDAEEMNWDLAAVVLTGLGTTGLAVATAILAQTTWRDVTATQELAKTAARDLREKNQPIIVMRLHGLVGPNEAPRLKVELQNIGEGPATNIKLSAGWTDAGGVEHGGDEIQVQPLGATSTANHELPVPGYVGTVHSSTVVTKYCSGSYTDRRGIELFDIPRLEQS